MTIEELKEIVKDATQQAFDAERISPNEKGARWSIIASERLWFRTILDSVEFEPRWIPVTERLPEEAGTYLVTLEYKEHGTGITTLWFHGSLGWDMRVADVVTAWMPLPKPYREVQE